MYAGLGKGDGGIVGTAGGEAAGGDLAEVCASSSAEEALSCDAVDADGNPVTLMLSAALDPDSGDVVWSQAADEQAVLRRVVGMSQMTSMLHDTDRNGVYERALQVCLTRFAKEHGRGARVLDIGTGTALLAMFAARGGAEVVVGCEMFGEMASIADAVVAANGFADTVQVVPAKSTAIDSLAPLTPDVLVSELLDSALLGEACMYAHGDAISRFMGGHGGASEAGARAEAHTPLEDRVLPHSADVFAVLIDSADVAAMRDVHVGLHGCSPFRDATAACPGGWSFVPLHWQEVEGRGAGRRLSEPHKVMHVDFFHGMPAAADDDAMETDAYLFGEGCFETDLPVTRSGDVAGVLCWWNTFLLSPSLDPARSLAISTEPGARPWQDHWLQVVFPLPASLPCAEGDVVRVTVAHDAVHMWLAAAKHGSAAKADVPSFLAVSPVPVERRLRPAQCTCGWHLLCGPERLQMLNDGRRKALWERATAALLDGLDGPAGGAASSIPVVADVGDGSLLSLGLAAALRARLQATTGTALSALRVVSAEKKQFSRLLHWALVEANGLEDLMYVWDGDDWGDAAAYHGPEPDDDGNGNGNVNDGGTAPSCAVRAVICEPVFYQLHALPTWQAVAVHYKLRALAVAQVLRADALVAPRRAWVMAAVFELTDLAGSFGAVGAVAGLDHGALDRRQEGWHAHFFPLKLQAYRKRMLTEPVAIATIDYTSLTALEDQAAAATTTAVTAPVVRAGRGDCVALWVDYDLQPARLGSGSGVDGGSDMVLQYWARHASGSAEMDFPVYFKAAVKFFPHPVPVDPDISPAALTATVAMELGASDFSYTFQLR